MSRLLYIPGFGNGPASERLLSALAHNFNVEDVDTLPFTEAMEQPDRIRKAAQGALCAAHSAAIMALRGTSPDVIHAFNPPLPLKIPSLLAKTGVKTIGMFRRGMAEYGIDGLRDGLEYTCNSTTELALHPIANLRHLPQIAKTDAITYAQEAAKSGVAILPSWTRYDDYFYPSTYDRERAAVSGISVECNLPGEHDELVLRPELFLHRYVRSFESRGLGSSSESIE